MLESSVNYTDWLARNAVLAAKQRKTELHSRLEAAEKDAQANKRGIWER